MNYKLRAALLVIANSLLKAPKLEVYTPSYDDEPLFTAYHITADAPIADIHPGPVSDEEQISFLQGIIQKAKKLHLKNVIGKNFIFA